MTAPMYLIGVPALFVPVYVWIRFARTPRIRRTQ